ncbi:hypothetical protein C2E23DRAFT_863243 [Lenzites betulinus]|nr:hypothetical protein C2E23DRAFT_863243 [Lenzites betulinus]
MEPEPHLQLAERLGGLEVPFPEYTSTGFGIRTRMPVLPPKEGSRHSIYIGVLACVGGDGNLTGLFLHANRTWMSNGYYIGMDKDDDGIVYRTVSLTDEVFAQWEPPEVVEVYLPTRVMTSSPWIEAPPESLSDAFATYDILLPEWRIRELEAQGYTQRRCRQNPDHRHIDLSCRDLSGPPRSPSSSTVAFASPILRRILTSQAGQAHGPVDTMIGQSTATPLMEEDSPRLGVTHDIAHPEHVNNSSWFLDDESCTAVSKDFLCCAEDGQVTEAIRLTLSPSPEQWASYGTPQTWSTVYTLDIGIIDRKDVVDMLDS